MCKDKLHHKSLYGLPIREDLARKHLTPNLLDNSIIRTNKTIKGEEYLDVQRVCVGGIILTTRKIGKRYVCKFNSRQYNHIKKHTFVHKILCERKDESIALLFLSLSDLVGEKNINNYNKLRDRELCNIITNNIKKIIVKKYSWIIDYSKDIVKNYYNISKNKLKIKLNFILDDGLYNDEYKNSLFKCMRDKYRRYKTGGLFTNNLLEILEFYNSAMYDSNNFIPNDDNELGIICQVLAPSGLPEEGNWLNIDIGVSFSGKRRYRESITEAMIREAEEEIHINVDDDVVKSAQNRHKFFYGGLPYGFGYDGFEIHIWKILDPYKISLIKEPPLDYSFCKCKEREKIITQNYFSLNSDDKKLITYN